MFACLCGYDQLPTVNFGSLNLGYGQLVTMLSNLDLSTI